MRKKLEYPWFMFITDPEPGGGADPVDPPVDPVDPNPVEDPATDPADDDTPLGGAGERALEALKKKDRETRAKLRAAESKIQELSKPADGEQTAEQIRAAVESDVRSELRRELISARVEVAAASLFADPEDAIAFLNLDDLDVDATGKVDPADIEDALKDLLTRKPHLAKQDGTQRANHRRVPEVPADPANVQSKPASLDERIAKAQADGDYKTVIALQNERLENAS